MTPHDQKQLLYRKLNALRLEVHESIVDDIKQTVDALFAPAPAQGVEEDDAVYTTEESVKEWMSEELAQDGLYQNTFSHNEVVTALSAFGRDVIKWLREDEADSSRWQQGQGVEDWQRQYSDLLEWTIMLVGPLKELVELKQMKDEQGKTAEYEERQPKAWYMARNAVAMWEERGNYGLKLKHVIPQPPTIGARWVKCPACGGDGKETCHNPDHGFIEAMPGETGRLGCPVCGHDPNHKVKNGGDCEGCNGAGKVTESDYGRVADWCGTHEDPEPIDESPATFPTREQATEWVAAEYPGEDIFDIQARSHMLDMYYWIVKKLNGK